MKPARIAARTSVVALSVIVVLLGASFAYYYDTTQSQISTLRQSGRSYCEYVDNVSSNIQQAFSNITESLQQQVQSDKAIIVTLNSTQPAGYQGMVATLNNEIAQDLGIISGFNSINGQISSIPTFCATVSKS
jgi:predicted lipoprotein